MPEWYDDSSALLYRIKCFVADFQEPYVLLRYDADTPLFDERFVNYGYNKVQLFENLRALSYNFFIWNDIFAMDLPHPDSKFRKSYITGLKVRSSPMKEMYSVFQSELNEKYAMNKPSKVCRTLQRKYYSPVLYSVVCSPFCFMVTLTALIPEWFFDFYSTCVTFIRRKLRVSAVFPNGALHFVESGILHLQRSRHHWHLYRHCSAGNRCAPS